MHPMQQDAAGLRIQLQEAMVSTFKGWNRFTNVKKIANTGKQNTEVSPIFTGFETC
jgi:hypothetical protein